MSSAPTIPATIDAVTVPWLNDVTGLDVDTAEAEQIGVGVGVSSALYRLTLTGRSCPGTMVVKLPALDESAAFVATMLRMYIREVRFFSELASDAPVLVPRAYYAAVDEETSRFVLVMEDLGAMRPVDQLAGMAIDDAERAVDGLAAWHSVWWRKADVLAERSITVSLADPIYPAVLPAVFREGWAKVTSHMTVPDAILEVGPHLAGAVPGLLDALGRGPSTMVHGDYRADNILFAPDGSVCLVDFQLIGTGRGAYDLAYFVTQSLARDVAADHERALFDGWIDRLLVLGVPAVDLTGAWEDYRTAALFCLVYPIVASRGMNLSDPRQHGLVECMIDRFARAVDDLDLVQLL